MNNRIEVKVNSQGIKKPQVAVCFFGITRSLKFTHESILKNIVAPLGGLCSYRMFAHYYDIGKVDSRRSKENVVVDKNEFRLLEYDYLILEKPQHISRYAEIEILKKFGDHWNNQFGSFKNLIYQLNSLREISRKVQLEHLDICLFVRPDLIYHDSFEYVLQNLLNDFLLEPKSGVYLPSWQSYRGFNDRFAICVGSKAIEAYGNRIKEALNFCAETDRPLHSESLLKYALIKANIPVYQFSLTASRVRANGEVKEENFST